MTIRAKVISSFVVVLLLFASVSFYNYKRSTKSNERLTLIQNFVLPLSRKIAVIEANVNALAEDMRRYIFQDKVNNESGFSRVARDLYPYIIRRKLRDIEDLVNRNRAVVGPEFVRSMGSLVVQTLDEFEILVKSRSKEDFQRTLLGLHSRLQKMSHTIDDQAETITSSAQAEVEEHLFGGYLLSLVVVFFGIFTIIFSYQALKPLPALIKSIKRIADGDLGESLKVKRTGSDEVSNLAREYNRMLTALNERDQQIVQQQRDLLKNEKLAAVGQLSAEIVHEIRNPLNSISLNLDWLHGELKQKDHEVSKAIASMSKEIRRLHEITESYLVRARVPSPDIDNSVNAVSVIREIVEFGTEEDRRRKIKVEAQYEGENLLVQTDRSSLKQALLNLIKNAREAMPCGGTLSIFARQQENASEITIRDTGHGMSPSVKRSSFQAFYTTKRGGTGLGLMLAKEIIEKAHGTVECRSELGMGTEFILRFPVNGVEQTV